MIFETRDQKKFVKNDFIRSELSKVEQNIKAEVDNVSKKFLRYVNQLREDKINISFKDKYNKFRFNKDEKTAAKKEALRQEKYQDLLGYENQVETIHKDFAEIDTIHKIHFIEVNNVELKQKLMNEATEIRGNIKDLIRNKFKLHIEGIVDLLMSIINEFKEGIE